MALVPRDTQRVLPSASALPYSQVPSANAAAFGALTGQALESLGNDFSQAGTQVGQVVAKINEENIQREARNRFNTYNDFKQSLMLGDGTPDNPGLLGLKGEDAMMAYPQVQAAIQQKKQELTDTTGNQYVKDMFTNAAAVSDNTDLSQMLSHVSQQREVANDVTSAATIKSATSRAALYNTNPDVLQASLDTVTATILSDAKRKGITDPDALQSLVKEGTSKVLEGTVTALSEFNTKAAQTLFAQHEQEMDGVTRGVVQQRLEAKHKQDVADMENQERFQVFQVAQKQKANFDALAGGIGAGTVTYPQVVQAEQLGRISGEQLENLHTYLTNPDRNTPENKYAENVLLSNIYAGTADIQDVMSNTAINGSQRTTLINAVHTFEDNGGVMKRNDVQQSLNFIGSMTVHQTGPYGLMDDASAQRQAQAKDDFTKGILAMSPGERTTAAVEKLRNEVVSMYHAGDVDLKTLPSTLPSSRFLPNSGGIKSKEQWQASILAARAALDKASEAGTLSQQDAIQQLSIIEQYSTTVNGIK